MPGFAKGLRAVAAVLLAAATGSAAAQDVAGTVKKTVGDVRVERGSERVAIGVGSLVRANDRVVTGAGASVGVTLRDDTMLALGPDSSIVIEQFAFNSTTHEGNLGLRIVRGTLAAITGLIARARPAAVTVRTPTATAGVRGTEFIVEVSE